MAWTPEPWPAVLAEEDDALTAAAAVDGRAVAGSGALGAEGDVKRASSMAASSASSTRLEEPDGGFSAARTTGAGADDGWTGLTTAGAGGRVLAGPPTGGRGGASALVGVLELELVAAPAPAGIEGD